VHGLEGIQHRLDPSTVKGSINTVIKRFQIDIGTIQVFAEPDEWFPVNVAV
jgi:hypothetical protein